MPLHPLRVHLTNLQQPLPKLHILRHRLQEMAPDPPHNLPHRFHQAPQLQRPDRRRWQHGRKQKVIHRAHDRDMVILDIQILNQSNTPPPAPKHHKLRLGLLPLVLLAVVIVDEDLSDGEVLGAAALGVERADGDGDVGRGQVVAIGRGVVDEEGEDDAAGREGEEASIGEGAVEEAEEGAAGAGEGFGGDGACDCGFGGFDEAMGRLDGERAVWDGG